MDLARIERAVAAGLPVPPVLRGLIRPRLRQVTASIEDPSSLRTRLAAMPAEARRAAIEEIVRREVTVVLGFGSSDTIGADQPLRDMGFDSLMAVELRNRLSALAGTTLPAMLALNHPSIAALSKKLAEDYFAAEPGEARARKALRATDVDQALYHLREAGLVESLKNAGLLEPVVEVLGELSLEGGNGGGEAISRDRALHISRNMDEGSVDAKLDSILDA
jgi:acyl carrier protein